MTTYQEMVFGTNGNDGYVHSVSEDYFGDTYGYTYSGYYDSWVDYGGSPYYGDYYDVGQAYQNPATVPTTPTAIYQEQFNVPSATPIAQGLHSQIKIIADLGAVGDSKTVQMETNRYRTLTRTGQDSYSWKDTDKNGNILSSGSSRSDGVLLANQITFQPSASPAQALPSSPAVLVESPTGAKITTADVPTVGSSASVTTPDGGLIIVSRVEDGSYQYYEHKGNSGIVAPAKQLTPGPSGSSPQSSYSAAPSVAPIAKLVSSAPTASKPAAGSPKPALSFPGRSETKPSPSAETPYNIYYQMLDDEAKERLTSGLDGKGKGEGLPGEEDQDLTGEEAAGKGKGEGLPGEEDEVLTIQEAGTYEQFSTTHPGAVDVVENGTGKVLRSYYPETGKDVTAEDETFAGVDTESLNLPEVSPIEEKQQEESAENDYSNLYPSDAPITISSSITPLPFDFPKPEGFEDTAPPQTGEELGYVFAESLSTYNPEGNENGDNEKIAKHFTGLIPVIIQGEIDPAKLGDLIDRYEEYKNGATSSSHMTYVPGIGYVGETVQEPFNTLELHKQKKIIQELITAGAQEDIPIGYTLALVNELINTEGREGQKRSLSDYVEHGQLEKDLRAFGTGSPVSKLMRWATSDEGLVTIGAAFGALATAGAFVVGGPLAGVGALGMSEYASTELVQMFGSNVFKTKAQQQNAGVYSADHKMRYNEAFKSTEQQFYDFGKYYKDWDAATRVQKLAALKQAYKDQGTQLRAETVFLSDLGIYPSELKRWQNLGNSFDGLEKLVDPITGELTGLKSIPAELNITPPDGGRVVGPDFVVGARNSPSITLKDQGTVSVQIYDKNDNLVKTEAINYYPGNIITKDYSNLLAYESTKSGSGAADVTTGKTTIYVPEGIKFDYLGKTYTGGQGGTSFDIKREAGAPLRITFESVDGSKKPLTEYIGFPDTGWNQYSVPADLKGSIGGSVQGLQTYLSEGQRLYWKDLDITQYIDKGTGLVSLPGAGYYNLSVVNPDGSKETKNVYVGENKIVDVAFEAIPQKPFTPYKSTSSGGGGGGGSSGGSRSRGSSYQPKPVEQTLIKYGPTCKGAAIYQDEVQVYPEIDVEYSIDPGYHSIKIEKAGMQAWIKTVYCASGDTLTVSPSFEPLKDSYTPPDNTDNPDNATTRRVFVNSDPSGGKVLINGSASGQWTPCYLDLPRGYYIFTIVKSGYADYDILCYIGDIIAWNQQATDLAKLEGLI